MTSDGDTEQDKFRRKLRFVSPIASPLANKKLTKKSLGVVSRAAKVRLVKRGVKEVVKALKKGQKGLCIIAGDISPIDVITHVPILCEEANVPYIYVPSKEDLGAAGATKRPTSCMLVLPPEALQLITKDMTEMGDEKKKEVEDLNMKFKEEYDETIVKVKALAASLF